MIRRLLEAAAFPLYVVALLALFAGAMAVQFAPAPHKCVTCQFNCPCGSGCTCPQAKE